MLWILIVAMTLAVVALLIYPLLRKPRPDTPARVDYDIVVYRDQLSEVDQEVEQGLLKPEQATVARAEIHRRMLASEDSEVGTQASVHGGSRRLRLAAICAIALLLPAGAGALYAVLGSPKMPDKPYAWRLANDPEFLSALSADKLKAMLEANPTAAGYKSLAGMYFSARDYQNAADADERAIDLGASDAVTMSELGEALVMANGGAVVPEALTAFTRALSKDGRSERSRFYIGLAEAQAGNERKAVAIWRDLVKTSDPNAAWLPMVRGHIDAFAKQGGFDPSSIAPEPPSPDMMNAAMSAMGAAMKAKTQGSSAAAPDAAAASGPSADPQQDAIHNMVAKLAGEMKSKPNDVAGWTQLAHSYNVLGQTREARAAIDHAVALQPNNANALSILAETEKAQEPEGEKSAIFTATMRRILAIAPSNPEALYYVGLAESRDGHAQQAQAMWRKALSGLPSGDPLAKEIQNALGSSATVKTQTR